ALALQPESTQPPPIPIQLDEYSASPAFRCCTSGTIQSALIDWTVVPSARVPCMYPDQLKDSLAPTSAIGRANRTPGGARADAARTSNASSGARRTRPTPQPVCQ